MAGPGAMLILLGLFIFLVWAAKTGIFKPGGTNKNLPVKTRVINYFVNKTVLPGETAWRGNVKEDGAYDELVKNHININDVKMRAIEKLGLDESELTEIEPFHFENYFFGTDDDISEFMSIKVKNEYQYQKANIIIGIGSDGKLRSSAYQVSWLFSTPKQVCIYQEIIYLHKNETDEITRQFLWKHITSITSLRNTLKFKTQSGQGKTEKVDVFHLTVAGDSFTCSMTPTDYTSKAINAMKQRLLDFS